MDSSPPTSVHWNLRASCPRCGGPQPCGREEIIDAALPVEIQLHPGDLGPADRRNPKTAARLPAYIESVGGSLHGFWYAFGSHDGYTLWEAPDNVSMAAVALAIGGGGALSSLETTVLLSVDETIEALRKAEGISYRAPGT